MKKYIIMLSWTLIVAFNNGLTNLPGFTSKQSCDEASKQLSDFWYTAKCVEVK
jgi:hypothetical protein